MLNDESRKRLAVYCPEIMEIVYRFRFSHISEVYMADLIATALTRRIQERGEWDSFEEYSRQTWREEGFHGRFILWLLDPARFAELADGAIEQGVIGG